MNIVLNEVEVRVLGSLVEKGITTPEYYPLSLNALTNACNQKSSRDPVMELSDDAVREALYSLDEKGLASTSAGSSGRVSKFEHRLQEVFNFDRRETAVFCMLLLRGPQTPGELRGRTERMHHFEDLDEVQFALQRLMQREPPLVKLLPRQPGTKEARYAHLMAGDVEAPSAAQVSMMEGAMDSSEKERVARMEEEIASLRNEVEELKRLFADFRKQFE